METQRNMIRATESHSATRLQFEAHIASCAGLDGELGGRSCILTAGSDAAAGAHVGGGRKAGHRRKFLSALRWLLQPAAHKCGFPVYSASIKADRDPNHRWRAPRAHY